MVRCRSGWSVFETSVRTELRVVGVEHPTDELEGPEEVHESTLFLHDDVDGVPTFPCYVCVPQEYPEPVGRSLSRTLGRDPPRREPLESKYLSDTEND